MDPRDEPVVFSPNDLMRAFYGGQEDAFANLYHLWQGRVYGFFRRRGQSRFDAEDLTQDTFILVYNTRTNPVARFQTDLRFSPWLFRIAARAAVDLHRRQQKQPRLMSPGIAASFPVLVRPPEIPELPPYLDHLDDNQRTFVLLWERGFGDLSQSEIAQVLGVVPATVTSIKQSALQKISEVLSGLEERPRRKKE